MRGIDRLLVAPLPFAAVAMAYHIEIARPEPTFTAVIRSQVPGGGLAKFVPAACGEVWAYLQTSGLPRPGRHLAVYFGAGDFIEVGAEMAAAFSGNARIRCSQLPAGLAATTTHFGPYPRLREAHAAVRAWCQEQGHQCSGVSWEIYGHWDEQWNTDASKIRTDIYHQLEACP